MLQAKNAGLAVTTIAEAWAVATIAVNLDGHVVAVVTEPHEQLHTVHLEAYGVSWTETVPAGVALQAHLRDLHWLPSWFCRFLASDDGAEHLALHVGHPS